MLAGTVVVLVLAGLTFAYSGAYDIGRPTHDDDGLWDIVAFVRQLPGMSAERYDALTKGRDDLRQDSQQKREEGGTES